MATTLAEKIAVMQAAVDGAAIQACSKRSPETGWNEVSTPSWDWHAVDYRVKPEEPEILHIAMKRGLSSTVISDVRPENLSSWENYGYKIKKFIEVME